MRKRLHKCQKADGVWQLCIERKYEGADIIMALRMEGGLRADLAAPMRRQHFIPTLVKFEAPLQTLLLKTLLEMKTLSANSGDFRCLFAMQKFQTAA